MGRWGERMFEGDQDLDMALDIAYGIGKPEKSAEFHWVPFFAQGYPDDEYPNIDAAAVCQALDTGLGDKLFDEWRAKEDGPPVWMWEGDAKYMVCLLGAMMMRVGAKIRDKDMQHLRELVPATPSNEGFTWALADMGFRGAGKRQFQAALNHYQAGTPRSFHGNSCFACGKIGADLGRPLLRCSRCESFDVAFFCDKDCQRASWNVHKSACGPRKSMMLNV